MKLNNRKIPKRKSLKSYAVSTKDHILIFLKGLLMGICDIIPGISGGTIAFITGIYERLMNAVKSFSPKVIKDIVFWLMNRSPSSKEEVKEDIKNLDLGFLIVLFSGIGISILLMSKVVGFLLENYFPYLIAFFMGLIFASSKIIYDHIRNHKLTNMMFGGIGILLGLSLFLFVPTKVDPSQFYLFISGFFAISAMFLPGISGAFILLIMGVYEHLINVLRDIFTNFTDIFFFGLGAILGAFTISRIIVFLFSKNKCRTLYLLLGLVIGCLSIPIRDVINTTNSFSLVQFAVLVLLFSLGITSVWIVNKLGSNKHN
jgi:putative membrane protein